MTDSESTYNFVCIRELLTAAFTRQTLPRFCQDRPLFRPILANLGPDSNLSQMIDEVMDYCRTLVLWDELLAGIKQENPRQYKRFEHCLRMPPEPPRKRLPSWRVVCVAIAALIIVLVAIICWIIRPPPFVPLPTPSPTPSSTPSPTPTAPPVVALRTAHNRYVGAMGADRDWAIRAGAETIDDYEEFTLLCQEDGKVVLQTWHKTADGNPRYVTPLGDDRDWLLIGETNAIGDWEQFTFLDADSGNWRSCSDVIRSLKDDGQVRVAFQTWHPRDGKHRLVTAMDADWDWVLRAETTELREAERFTIILLP